MTRVSILREDMIVYLSLDTICSLKLKVYLGASFSENCLHLNWSRLSPRANIQIGRAHV